MVKTRATPSIDCIDCYREELLIYLVQRFGSFRFAKRIFTETQKRLANSEIQDCVPNPHIYLISYALSLGLELMQKDHADNHHRIRKLTAIHCIPKLAQRMASQGGDLWQSTPLSTLH